MQHVLLIALGGSLGAVARYGLSTYVYHAANESFPWGTLAVNLVGSFLIGAVIELFDASLIPPPWRSFVTIGFLGAFTTFSTYTFETVGLLRDGELKLAALNVVGANLAGVALVVLGMMSARLMLKLFS